MANFQSPRIKVCLPSYYVGSRAHRAPEKLLWSYNLILLQDKGTSALSRHFIYDKCRNTVGPYMSLKGPL